MGFVLEPAFGIVTNWCDGQTLYKHIHVLNTRFDNKQICQFFHQIADGMEFEIIILDIYIVEILFIVILNLIVFLFFKLDIFLIGEEVINIGDFGLATIINTANMNKSQKPRSLEGSLRWMVNFSIKRHQK